MAFFDCRRCFNGRDGQYGANFGWPVPLGEVTPRTILILELAHSLLPQVSEFAPPSCQRFLSYIAGWLSALGWQAFIAVAAFQGGVLILNLATLKNPNYVRIFSGGK